MSNTAIKNYKLKYLNTGVP